MIRSRSLVQGLAGLAVLGMLGVAPVAAQNAAHAHIGHVADAFPRTPDGGGLLPTAVADAQTAAQHAGFAMRDPSNLDAMKRHMGHVLHAITGEGEGPGSGFGVKAGAAGAIQHIEMAAANDAASDNVKTHAGHVATSARNVERWSDEVVSLANEILDATDDSAADLLHEVVELLDAIVEGTDANGDGRIGWQEGEGGLEQATFHMNAMKRGEGLGG